MKFLRENWLRENVSFYPIGRSLFLPGANTLAYFVGRGIGKKFDNIWIR
jgi:hypothetical protein